MPWKSNPDLLAIVGALIISTLSGFISIAQRVTRGQAAKPLWVISEIFSAILCGYLAYDAYPHIQDTLPTWATWPIVVAFAAHVGGRAFQIFENAFYRRYQIPPPPQGPIS